MTGVIKIMVAPHISKRLHAIRYICRIILAPTVIGSAVYYLTSRFGLTYKPFLVLCGIVVGWPITFSLGVKHEGWRRERRARAFGAVTAPQSRWKLFSDLDVLREIREINKSGFVGELTCLGCDLRIILSDTALFA